MPASPPLFLLRPPTALCNTSLSRLHRPDVQRRRIARRTCPRHPCTSHRTRAHSRVDGRPCRAGAWLPTRRTAPLRQPEPAGPGRRPEERQGRSRRRRQRVLSEKMAGLPVGVQVVDWRWEDEKVVEMMRSTVRLAPVTLDRSAGRYRASGRSHWTSKSRAESSLSDCICAFERPGSLCMREVLGCKFPVSVRLLSSSCRLFKRPTSPPLRYPFPFSCSVGQSDYSYAVDAR